MRKYPIRCIALECPSDSRTSDVSFFKFPKEVDRARIWLTVCGRQDLLNKADVLHRLTHRICAHHFESRMFTSTKRKRLSLGAVPTLQSPESFFYYASESIVNPSDQAPPSFPNAEAIIMIEDDEPSFPHGVSQPYNENRVTKCPTSNLQQNRKAVRSTLTTGVITENPQANIQPTNSPSIVLDSSGSYAHIETSYLEYVPEYLVQIEGAEDHSETVIKNTNDHQSISNNLTAVQGTNISPSAMNLLVLPNDQQPLKDDGNKYFLLLPSESQNLQTTSSVSVVSSFLTVEDSGGKKIDVPGTYIIPSPAVQTVPPLYVPTPVNAISEKETADIERGVPFRKKIGIQTVSIEQKPGIKIENVDYNPEFGVIKQEVIDIKNELPDIQDIQQHQDHFPGNISNRQDCLLKKCLMHKAKIHSEVIIKNPRRESVQPKPPENKVDEIRVMKEPANTKFSEFADLEDLIPATYIMPSSKTT